jgi:hypothetical protein
MCEALFRGPFSGRQEQEAGGGGIRRFFFFLFRSRIFSLDFLFPVFFLFFSPPATGSRAHFRTNERDTCLPAYLPICLSACLPVFSRRKGIVPKSGNLIMSFLLFIQKMMWIVPFAMAVVVAGGSRLSLLFHNRWKVYWTRFSKYSNPAYRSLNYSFSIEATTLSPSHLVSLNFT